MTLPRDAAALLATELLGVLSTVGIDGRPQSALVAFSTLAGRRLVVGMSADSRKHQNLLRDPRVSFVVSRGEQTLQIEGTARPAGDDDAPCRAAHVEKNPRSAKYANDPDTVVESRF